MKFEPKLLAELNRHAAKIHETRAARKKAYPNITVSLVEERTTYDPELGPVDSPPALNFTALTVNNWDVRSQKTFRVTSRFLTMVTETEICYSVEVTS